MLEILTFCLMFIGIIGFIRLNILLIKGMIYLSDNLFDVISWAGVIIIADVEFIILILKAYTGRI